eukprot:TRINITY_DN20287_c0_g2_i2.p1 TRINITY_DN20287_c0_g2~~TRINITY_DN20287_c0_g2_i2.p1  ORF type:complete len:299 (-),score=49.98 TRINITY_DN20287_c0_g2_i2:596-1492(-)
MWPAAADSSCAPEHTPEVAAAAVVLKPDDPDYEDLMSALRDGESRFINCVVNFSSFIKEFIVDVNGLADISPEVSADVCFALVPLFDELAWRTCSTLTLCDVIDSCLATPFIPMHNDFTLMLDNLMVHVEKALDYVHYPGGRFAAGVAASSAHADASLSTSTDVLLEGDPDDAAALERSACMFADLAAYMGVDMEMLLALLYGTENSGDVLPNLMMEGYTYPVNFMKYAEFLGYIFANDRKGRDWIAHEFINLCGARIRRHWTNFIEKIEAYARVHSSACSLRDILLADVAQGPPTVG